MTSVSLSICLSKHRKKILLMDLDTQGHSKKAFGYRNMNEYPLSMKDAIISVVNEQVSQVLHVFESVIDLMSYQMIQRNRNFKWTKNYYLSLGGASIVGKQIGISTIPLFLTHFLENNPKIKQIRVHSDDDKAEYNVFEKIRYYLQNKYEVIDERPIEYKDFNEMIRYKKYFNTDGF